MSGQMYIGASDVDVLPCQAPNPFGADGEIFCLQSELIRIAVEMESSMLGKVGPDGKRSDRVRTSADLQVSATSHQSFFWPYLPSGPDQGSGLLASN